MDPLDQLAFAIHGNPGAYALLVGSGVSRAAGMPTGHEIALDLVRKLGTMKGDDCGDDPETWYREQGFGEPTYSSVVTNLGTGPVERQGILRPYFEPSDSDGDGSKAPTQAHRAIARLCKSGHVRIIITTNFDRLLESALEAVGVHPTVVATSADAKGALALVHQKCLLLKLNGDYLSPTIKNTEEELAKYDQNRKRMLREIVRDFGLVVCGWSGDYDIALREVIRETRQRTFPIYWAARGGQVRDSGRQIVDATGAVQVAIDSADSFFDELAERLQALEGLDRQHPISIDLMVERARTYVSEPRHRVRMDGLISGERDRVRSAMELMSWSAPTPNGETMKNRIEEYEALTEGLLRIATTVAYWGQDPHHSQALVRTIEELAAVKTADKNAQTYTAWRRLSRYPALLLIYSCGISALAGKNFRMLARVVFDPTVAEEGGSHALPNSQPLLRSLDGDRVLTSDLYAKAYGSSVYFAMSGHIRERLWQLFGPSVAKDKADFDTQFERFEYLWVLEAARLEWQLPCGVYLYKWHFSPQGLHDKWVSGYEEGLTEVGMRGHENPDEAREYIVGWLERWHLHHYLPTP